ncbi:MAG: HAMP domain-containing histidine kinase [Ruminococcaceae bacterium]|nr:HAMP domain-containing histidine kinase [Oscillospiraceae bacterium]
MKNNKRKDKRLKDSIFSLWRFILYFLITGFAVSVSFLLFFSGSLFDGANYPVLIPDGTVGERALRTLLNIIFICIFMSVIDGVRKRIFTKRPVTRILDTLSKITAGDLTARTKPLHKKRAFNEYDLIIEDINKMAQELSSIETLKTDFISNVSHEIKTPLSVIQNYAGILQSENLTEEERKEYAARLSAASKKLGDLITAILRLNRLENQQIFPEKQKFNLSEQLCQAILIYENEWTKKNIEIVTDLDDSIIIEGDSELFLTVWLNLVSNAVKFTDEGGKITVTLKKQNSCAVVSVSDTGCGMTEFTGKKIFEKFYQADTSHTVEGNGLGLALVKRIIDITKSKITVESELGKGSCFTVYIKE